MMKAEPLPVRMFMYLCVWVRVCVHVWVYLVPKGSQGILAERQTASLFSLC